MITANANYVLTEGSEVKYASTSLYVDYKYDNRFRTFQCELIPLGAAVSAPPLGSFYFLTDKATVDAKSPAGVNSTDRVLDQVEQVVIDYLQGITENSSVTFSN